MDSIIEAKGLLCDAQNVIILGGAGMSVNSGLKTYWDGDNAQYANEMSEFGYPTLEHSMEYLWEKDAIMQLKFHNAKFRKILEAPVDDKNGIYKTLLTYLEENKKSYFAVTTNTDGAFLRSGYNNQKVSELHGSTLNSQCLAQPSEHGVFPTNNPYESWTKCPTCDYYVRPNVLFFNDLHINYSLIYEQHDRFLDYRETLNPSKSVVLEFGAGVTVPTLRNLSVIMNGRENIPVIRINLNSHSTMVDGIANLIPRSRTAPFITLLQDASSGLNDIIS